MADTAAAPESGAAPAAPAEATEAPHTLELTSFEMDEIQELLACTDAVKKLNKELREARRRVAAARESVIALLERHNAEALTLDNVVFQRRRRTTRRGPSAKEASELVEQTLQELPEMITAVRVALEEAAVVEEKSDLRIKIRRPAAAAAAGSSS